MAGRYLLNGGHRSVTNCITIGSPLLGTPVAYKRILDGGFYGVLLGAIDYFTDPAITDVLRGFPGFHELFPSPEYFKLRTGPLIFGEGFPWTTVEQNRLQIREFFDTRYPRNQPVAANEAFHSSAQDDWSGLPSELKILHIVGVQSESATVGAIQVKSRNWLSRTLHSTPVIYKSWFEFGDGTVAFNSANRTLALRAPSTDTMLILSEGRTSGEYSDESAEHTGLTMNRKVHRNLLSWLRVGKTSDDSANRQSLSAQNFILAEAGLRRRSLEVSFAEVVAIVTPDGPLSRVEGYLRTFLSAGRARVESQESATTVRYPAHGTYELTLAPLPGESFIGFIERSLIDTAGSPVKTSRFLEIAVPQGGFVRIRDVGQDELHVEVDTNADGVFETLVKPDYTVEGELALDVTPPLIALKRICQDGNPFMEIIAVDEGHGLPASGVDRVRFTPSGISQTGLQTVVSYSAPFPVTANLSQTIGVLAVDRAGNQNGGPFETMPRVSITKTSDFVRVTWEKTCWPIIIEEAAPFSNESQWSPLLIPIQDFGGEQGVDLPLDKAESFFRLRLSP